MEDGLKAGVRRPAQPPGLRREDADGVQGVHSQETRGQGHPDVASEGVWGPPRPQWCHLPSWQNDDSKRERLEMRRALAEPEVQFGVGVLWMSDLLVLQF